MYLFPSGGFSGEAASHLLLSTGMAEIHRRAHPFHSDDECIDNLPHQGCAKNSPPSSFYMLSRSVRPAREYCEMRSAKFLGITLIPTLFNRLVDPEVAGR